MMTLPRDSHGRVIRGQRMTPRRAKLLRFIIRYSREHGCPPSCRDMMRVMGVRATNAVTELVDKLERDGFVRRHLSSKGVKPGSRALKVLVWPDGVPYDLTRGRADELRAELPERVVFKGSAGPATVWRPLPIGGYEARAELVRVL